MFLFCTDKWISQLGIVNWSHISGSINHDCRYLMVLICRELHLACHEILQTHAITGAAYSVQSREQPEAFCEWYNGNGNKLIACIKQIVLTLYIVRRSLLHSSLHQQRWIDIIWFNILVLFNWSIPRAKHNNEALNYPDTYVKYCVVHCMIQEHFDWWFCNMTTYLYVMTVTQFSMKLYDNYWRLTDLHWFCFNKTEWGCLRYVWF